MSYSVNFSRTYSTEQDHYKQMKNIYEENEQLKKIIETIKKRHQSDKNLLNELFEEETKTINKDKPTCLKNKKEDYNYENKSLKNDFDCVISDIQNNYLQEIEFYKNNVRNLKDEIKELQLNNQELVENNNNLEMDMENYKIKIKKAELYIHIIDKLENRIKKLEEENKNICKNNEQIRQENRYLQNELLDTKQTLEEYLKNSNRFLSNNLADENLFNRVNLMEELKQISKIEQSNSCKCFQINLEQVHSLERQGLNDNNSYDKINDNHIIYLEIKALMEELNNFYYYSIMGNNMNDYILVENLQLLITNNNDLKTRINKIESDLKRKKDQLKTWNYLSQTNEQTNISMLNLELSKNQNEINEKTQTISNLHSELLKMKETCSKLMKEREDAKRETEMTRFTCDQYERKLIEMTQLSVKYQKKAEKIKHLKELLTAMTSPKNKSTYAKLTHKINL